MIAGCARTVGSIALFLSPFMAAFSMAYHHLHAT